MSTAGDETSNSRSSKPRIQSKSSRPAWALAWSRGERSDQPESFAPLPPLLNSRYPPSTAQSDTTGWPDDDDDVAPSRTTTINLSQNEAPRSSKEGLERPSSRLSDHLTQDQQDRQAVSNDMAGRRALAGARNDPGLPDPISQDQGGVTSSAVTIHDWDEDAKSTSTKMKASSTTQTHIGPGYPRLEPSRVYEEMLRRETVRPPVFGGRSKNMLLGSVAESWGTAPTLEIPRGMFQLEDDPPSPPPGVNMTPEEIQAEKARRALLGIPGEKSGRPSIKDMEKEIMDKLKNQKLREERTRSDIGVPEARGGSQNVRQGGSGWSPPVRRDQGQPSLSERLRAQDEHRRGDNEDDEW